MYSLSILEWKIAFILGLYRLLNMACSLTGIGRRYIAVLRDRADIAVYLRDVGGYTAPILSGVHTALV